ncbi:hypothetical protein C8R44DRAFT_858658 [Mycena epipterygia]|nr:hypothetical protein C8R44DRAFT_858658 [Mycena epipterygia]
MHLYPGSPIPQRQSHRAAKRRGWRGVEEGRAWSAAEDTLVASTPTTTARAQKGKITSQCTIPPHPVVLGCSGKPAEETFASLDKISEGLNAKCGRPGLANIRRPGAYQLPSFARTDPPQLTRHPSQVSAALAQSHPASYPEPPRRPRSRSVLHSAFLLGDMYWMANALEGCARRAGRGQEAASHGSLHHTGSVPVSGYRARDAGISSAPTYELRRCLLPPATSTQRAQDTPPRIHQQMIGVGRFLSSALCSTIAAPARTSSNLGHTIKTKAQLRDSAGARGGVDVGGGTACQAFDGCEGVCTRGCNVVGETWISGATWTPQCMRLRWIRASGWARAWALAAETRATRVVARAGGGPKIYGEASVFFKAQSIEADDTNWGGRTPLLLSKGIVYAGIPVRGDVVGPSRVRVCESRKLWATRKRDEREFGGSSTPPRAARPDGNEQLDSEDALGEKLVAVKGARTGPTPSIPGAGLGRVRRIHSDALRMVDAPCTERAVLVVAVGGRRAVSGSVTKVTSRSGRLSQTTTYEFSSSCCRFTKLHLLLNRWLSSTTYNLEKCTKSIAEPSPDSGRHYGAFERPLQLKTLRAWHTYTSNPTKIEGDGPVRKQCVLMEGEPALTLLPSFLLIIGLRYAVLKDVVAPVPSTAVMDESDFVGNQ